jgi:hypothetical protein
MEKQMVLPLDLEAQERLRRIWSQIPEESRLELVTFYARLIAQAVRIPEHSQQQESGHEPNDRC